LGVCSYEKNGIWGEKIGGDSVSLQIESEAKRILRSKAKGRKGVQDEERRPVLRRNRTCKKGGSVVNENTTESE